MTTDLVLIDENRDAAVALLIELERSGAIDEVSLNLTDPEISYDTWEALGRFLGSIDRRMRWWIGDWLNFGEAIFGEAAAQGVEATLAERYSEAERVTGLDHGTLMNIRSVCAKVARSRRRPELGFWIHAEVAPLPPAEQTKWLARAVKNAWTTKELRHAIAGKEPPEPKGAEGNSGDGLTREQRIEEAARHVYHQGQKQPGVGVVVADEPWARLAAALGED